MPESSDVRAVLKSVLKYAGDSKQTDYISVFYSDKGRELALERDRVNGVYIWVEKYNPFIPGVEVNNKKHPGQAYGAKQTRNSNLNDKNCPRLKLGNQVWYLKIDSLDSLKDFAVWYATC